MKLMSMTSNLLFVSLKAQNMKHLIVSCYDSAIVTLMKSWLLRFALNLLMERVQGGTPFVHSFMIS